MKDFYVDLHIHIGRTYKNSPVKITASKSLTLSNILHYASNVKGLNCIGIIDCHSPEVIQELIEKLREKSVFEHSGGGIVYNNLTLILGSEIEIYDESCQGPIHVLVFFPTIERMAEFSKWIQSRMKNYTLSSQRIYEKGIVLQKKVKELDGLFIPAHIFTPFKSVYGKGVRRSITEVFDPDLIDAVELGLSSDTTMANKIMELNRYTFISNSDAHSLEKIAREYQQIRMEEASFNELKKALKCQGNRKIVANYGLNPRLGKYHRTSCESCYEPLEDQPVCKNCGHTKFTKGVCERISELATEHNPPERPPYIHHIPLEFIPKLGPKTLEKLRNSIGTDMEIIHHASFTLLRSICSGSCKYNYKC